ncbi:TolB family protein [Bowmanella pacifica]|uniref:TolB protein n=1 Tax=Bowmanella pacifica TaxID=502051 RepID=A0A918DN13_9ALTE|nr:DPP IV N-terminal domain-containing protein [Bowmanella pacifica]GGO74142.1 hypothetical protein GCM10010982_36260 [Bowmanella pacifica]
MSCSAERATDAASSSAPADNSPLLLFVSNQDGDREIYSVDLSGQHLQQLTSNNRDDYEASWSPDGHKILFTSNRLGVSELYVMEANGAHQTNLSNHPGFDGQGAWSPDGQSVVYLSDRDGPIHLFILDLQSAALHRVMAPEDLDSSDAPAWSPDGNWIAYRKFNLRGKGDIWLFSVKDGVHRQLTNNGKHEDGPASWSPDSTTLLYHSKRNREYNLYRFDLNSHQETQLTFLASSDIEPSWSNDGKKILFLSTRGVQGRTQVYVMNSDGTNPQAVTDGSYQVADPAWLPNDRQVLLASWQGKKHSNIYYVNLHTRTMQAIAPAKGYQSQPSAVPATQGGFHASN